MIYNKKNLPVPAGVHDQGDGHAAEAEAGAGQGGGHGGHTVLEQQDGPIDHQWALGAGGGTGGGGANGGGLYGGDVMGPCGGGADGGDGDGGGLDYTALCIYHYTVLA